MDAFTDGELFDESVPHVSLPETDKAVDPLTVSSDDTPTHLYGEGAVRRVGYVLAALVMLGVLVLAFRAGRPSPEHQRPHDAVRDHHARLRAPLPRRRTAMRRRAPAETVPVVTAKVVVGVPRSSPERPTRTESVGTGRPIGTGHVGNTEQFGYLGR